ncbi:cell wall mannoprotein 1 family protein [Aspergillus lucknowensis]|uniref:Hydrophobic surface binding protein A-domain-containing protein n=1 Tax=Aspergillus lucknowensis TaxID=176173 RepID=A0ABR4LWC6_9EURO
MRFQPSFILAGLGAITTVLATPTKATWEPTLVERDTAAITSVVADINAKVMALGDDIRGYTGGDTSAIEAASTELVDTINAGTEIVADSDDLTAIEALDLVNPITSLTSVVDTTITDLIGKKDPVVEAGAGARVYTQLQAQLAAANTFAETLSSKVPPELKDIADELSAGIAASIQRGIDAYEDVSTTTTTTTTTTSSSTTTTSETTTTTETTSTTETTTDTTPPPTSTETPSDPCETETETETPPPSTTDEPCEPTPTPTDEPCEPTPTPTDEPCEPEPTDTDTETPPEPTETGPENPPDDSTTLTPTSTPTETGPTDTGPETPEFTGAAAMNSFMSSLAGAGILGAVVLAL